MATVSVAVVQAAPVAFDVGRTLERVGEWTRRAAAAGAQLVLFPEAFVSAYPRGLDFATTVGQRGDLGREWYRRCWDSAIDVPGPATEALGAIAREANIHLVIGVIEREGGTLYCVVLFFAPDGSPLGKHRKLVPTGAERLMWGQGDGSTMPVLATPIGRLGAAICWENYMPLYRMYLYSKNIQIYCAPTADARDTWQATARHIALEGRCFVLSCNQFATRGDYPADYPAFPGLGDGEVVCRGGSVIVGPLGEVLAGPLFDAPGILAADLDLDAVPRAKFDFDATGHYSRPDVFRLTVRE